MSTSFVFPFVSFHSYAESNVARSSVAQWTVTD